MGLKKFLTKIVVNFIRDAMKGELGECLADFEAWMDARFDKLEAKMLGAEAQTDA
jgi:hypothetical protein